MKNDYQKNTIYYQKTNSKKSAVELSFEELWKINPSDDDYDIKEKQYWKNVWEKCRSEILNNGNNQLRSVESEIDQYSVSWNGHVRNYSIGGQL